MYANVERPEDGFDTKRKIPRERQKDDPVIAIRPRDGPALLCQPAREIHGDFLGLTKRCPKGLKGGKGHLAGDVELGHLRLDQMRDPIGDGEAGTDHRIAGSRNTGTHIDLFNDFSCFDDGMKQDVCPCFGPFLADFLGFIVA